MLEGLRTDEETVQKVITLLAYGCPLQAIVRAFGLDEHTVAAIIKHSKKKRVVEITRKVTRGTREKAKELLELTKGGVEFNSAFIERFTEIDVLADPERLRQLDLAIL